MRRKIEDDLGFGNRVSGKQQRALNRDGSFNINRKGQSFWKTFDMYHSLITMKWWKFNSIVALYYIAINILFGGVYYLLGMQHLAGALGTSEREKFFDAFFFSAQTITTLGYGRISPVGFWTSNVAAIESVIGLMGFALITGLLYGKFSRPVAKIVQSKNAVMAPYKDINALMFRIVNGKVSQLIEVEMQVVFSFIQMEGGKTIRRFLPLELERSKIVLFPSSWTVVHPIDENSPMKNYTEQMLKEVDAEFFILLKAFDDSFSQTIYWRSSIKHTELIWGAKFVNILTPENNGSVTIDMSQFNAVEKAELNKPITETAAIASDALLTE